MGDKNLTLVQNKQNLTPTEVMQSLAKSDIQVIKQTVAKNTTDAELAMFLTLASRYGLDPFRKEIWCIKYDEKDAATIMTSRDGYLKIAQDHPDYLGLKSFVVKEGDTFEIDADSDSIVHKFGAKRGNIIGAWAACYRKGRKPSICFVDYSEYKKSNKIWNAYPSSMIQKVAETFVLKRQFGITGLVTQEEIDEGQEPINITPDVEVIAPEKPTSEKAKTETQPENKQEKNIDITPEETGKENKVVAEGPPPMLFEVLGLRPSKANSEAYELALKDQAGNKGMVFVLGEMAMKLLETVGLNDVIKAEIELNNGINILKSYVIAKKAFQKTKNNETKNETDKESKAENKDGGKKTPPENKGKKNVNITCSLTNIGFADQKTKDTLLMVLSDGKAELTAYTKDKSFIKQICDQITETKAGPGSKVTVSIQNDENGKYKVTAFKVAEALKVVNS